MTGIEVKSFDKPDETRMFESKGYVDIVTLAGRPVGRAVFEPGWRWSADVRPIAGTERCEVSHLAYCVSGRIRIHMADGSEQDVTPGEAVAIAPGHDAEVIGDEACVMLDFGEISQYARRG
ncbi:cupin [Actinomadura rubrobrunea]|uniref:Cupin n=1 Tax=Actinomadura rubrobrunea TaxID=115335 RepID=A0A9W6PRT2_9ACTN|nr:cupin domain-containing protein [Actinomadura rubrobrunea]GLW61888.1 cupin [Actinomadura rubrobrunea]